MYSTAEPESLNCTEYATKLRESLSKAYTVARKHVAGKQERQTETYNKKVASFPGPAQLSVTSSTSPQVPRGKSKSCIDGGQDHTK